MKTHEMKSWIVYGDVEGILIKNTVNKDHSVHWRNVWWTFKSVTIHPSCCATRQQQITDSMNEQEIVVV